jgi:AMP nucleosidase
VWEHDEVFKNYLEEIRAMAIDMETATLFSAAFKNHVPLGALLLISDQPMVPEGVKTEESDQQVSSSYVNTHIEIGIETLEEIKNEGLSVRHLKF